MSGEFVKTVGSYKAIKAVCDAAVAAAQAAQTAAEAALAAMAGGGLPSGGSNGLFLGYVNGGPAWTTSPTLSTSQVETVVGNAVTNNVATVTGPLDARFHKKGVTLPVADMPSGIMMYVRKGTTWGARPTDRNDIMVVWAGADPAPGIVTSGTTGARQDLDGGWV